MPPCQPAQEGRGLEKDTLPILLPPSVESGVKVQRSFTVRPASTADPPQQGTVLKTMATSMVPQVPHKVGVVGYGRLGEYELAWGLFLCPCS